MRRSVVALLAALAMAAWGAGTAAAEDPTAEAADQVATSDQAGGAASGATQSEPSNLNIAVRVLSPGDDGDVTQSNTVSSEASAANANTTDQSADQTQSGSGIQTAGQDASSSQLAAALSSAEQSGASNTNIPVRVLSPGRSGNVTQTNAVESTATGANLNATKQDVDQTQSGGSKCPCPTTGGIQTADQSSSNEQTALAKSSAEQHGAKNVNISVRVLSPGNGGDVTQSNSVSSSSTALNANATKQDVDQAQAGGSGKCCPSGPSVQTAEQDADNEQKAVALSSAKQVGATNTNVPVRVLSRGDDGDVSQSNSVTSSATAANLNVAEQDADQVQADGSQACCPSGPAIQTAKQEADSRQTALADSEAVQLGGKKHPCGCPSGGNTNTPVRVKSPGGDGDVTQTNDVASSATAANLNATKQDADQTQAGGSGVAIQTSDQSASNAQAALAGSFATQAGASNTNTPVRVKSPGGGGDVTQSNTVVSSATAANQNLIKQDADQVQRGGHDKCGCISGPAIQVSGQDAKSEQAALAKSAAAQIGASNTNGPVRVKNAGGDGSVSQSNAVSSAAGALNANLTGQSASQTQTGGGVAVQVIGQKATSHQLAAALSAALQVGATNSNAPVRVHSAGGDGAVSQSNTAASAALAANINATKQDARQAQRGGSDKCCPSVAVQALGQLAESKQAGLALSQAIQVSGKGKGKCGCPSGTNSNGPVRVDSAGGRGSLSQSNTVSSLATALNLNATHQAAGQTQSGGGIVVQGLGQAASNLQLSAAASLALQLAAANGRRGF